MSAPGGRIVLSAIDPVINSNGNLAANATITIYLTGTGTHAPIFSDQSLTTALQNPQHTDQNGRPYSQATAFFADVNTAVDVTVLMQTGETYSYNTIWPNGQAPSFSGFLSNPNVVLTGNPTAPTPVTSDNSSSIATTAFINNRLGTISIFPPGMIVPFAMTSLPTGWLICNGQEVSRTTYAGLFSAISTTWGNGDGSTTFNVPDFGGEFLRGWTSGQTVDSGRAFASKQEDAFQGHKHNFGTSQMTHTGTMAPYASGGDDPVWDNPGPAFTSDAVNGDHGTVRLSTETRPVNTSVIYGIRI